MRLTLSITCVLAFAAATAAAQTPPFELRLAVERSEIIVGRPIRCTVSVVNTAGNNAKREPPGFSYFNLSYSRDGKTFHPIGSYGRFQEDLYLQTWFFSVTLPPEPTLLFDRPGSVTFQAEIEDREGRRPLRSKPVTVTVKPADGTILKRIGPQGIAFLTGLGTDGKGPKEVLAALNAHPDAPQAPFWRGLLIEDFASDVRVDVLRPEVREAAQRFTMLYDLCLLQVRSEPDLAEAALRHLVEVVVFREKQLTAAEAARLAEAAKPMLAFVKDQARRAAMDAMIREVAAPQPNPFELRLNLARTEIIVGQPVRCTVLLVNTGKRPAILKHRTVENTVVSYSRDGKMFFELRKGPQIEDFSYNGKVYGPGEGWEMSFWIFSVEDEDRLGQFLVLVDRPGRLTFRAEVLGPLRDDESRPVELAAKPVTVNVKPADAAILKKLGKDGVLFFESPDERDRLLGVLAALKAHPNTPQVPFWREVLIEWYANKLVPDVDAALEQTLLQFKAEPELAESALKGLDVASGRLDRSLSTEQANRLRDASKALLDRTQDPKLRGAIEAHMKKLLEPAKP
jgi:hypothetical protein